MQKRFITPEDKFQYFFGYYDLQPYDETNEKHLVHRVKFLDREPTAEDIAELGYVKDGTFFKISETTSWNFQQGSLMQWYAGRIIRRLGDYIWKNTRGERNFTTAKRKSI